MRAHHKLRASDWLVRRCSLGSVLARCQRSITSKHVFWLVGVSIDVFIVEYMLIAFVILYIIHPFDKVLALGSFKMADQYISQMTTHSILLLKALPRVTNHIKYCIKQLFIIQM